MGLIEQFELDVQTELVRAREAGRIGNAGRARTAARRAVGFALGYWDQIYPHTDFPGDTMQRIRFFSSEAGVPKAVRDAAFRLQARLNSEFESASVTPVEDALMIIQYIKSLLI